MVKYSTSAIRALAFLKQAGNDIDVFVEDTSTPNIWLKLVRSVLPSGVRLASVTAVGGRNAVIAACKADQQSTDRPKLYLIDGDFDFVLKRRMPKLNHLYRIKAYCIENLLLEDNALNQVASYSDPATDEADLIAKLDYNQWRERNVRPLIPLFALYAIAHNEAPSIQTVGFPVQSLCLNGVHGAEICPHKVRARLVSVVRQLRGTMNHTKLKGLIEKIRGNIKRLDETCVVSAKDYIFPILLLRIHRLLGMRVTVEQLKLMLAAHWTGSNEKGLASAVSAACS